VLRAMIDNPQARPRPPSGRRGQAADAGSRVSGAHA
jgi:hypothetical protein